MHFLQTLQKLNPMISQRYNAKQKPIGLYFIRLHQGIELRFMNHLG